MLNALLRTASLTALMLIAACEFSSAPSLGQSSSNKKKGDADSEDPQAQRNRGVVVAKTLPESDAAADAAMDSSDAANAHSGTAGKGGAGGKSGGKTTAGKGGGDAKDDGDKSADDKGQNTPPQDDQKDQDKDKDPPANKTDAGPVDAGAHPPTPDAGKGDAGARPMVSNPIGVLEELAKRSAGGRTAETINRFLDTVAKGDAPAASIKDFLETINTEMDCKMNPFATECLAACQAVSTTCWVCVLDEPCRGSLLDICGYSALAGCVPRR